ncbi:ABC transporter ATP-binding protein [cf. Phormidesmis sp. LEGE 11477]|uniref:ABC transporter ATP-binding protein n=1 Tax=cf. Phormidesmis sp. LEGE 11477 TaxID=1828680 RepID=UPI00187E5E57|nr:ABC transporter ATP-binding protein [cf. Phormidesmis sp. LEGE 11477]MBE9060509.1 ABC transporter ATP-binding protein [cf. Phormidesmis sp. LEGE 11477]
MTRPPVINVSETRASQTSAEDVLIDLTDIELAYDVTGRAPFLALQDINLTLNTGDFVCAIGPSGCGKTSLLRVLAGYETPTYGSVSVDGRPHTKPDAEVGVVFQQPNLFPWMTIEKNVDFGPRMKGVDAHQRRQRVSRFLEMVSLIEAAKKLPHQLSGGMKQRAAIARALAADPKVILMDEPFGALDAFTRESMQMSLHNIWKKTNKTIFFITHDVEEALLLSTRVILMYANPGRIVENIKNPFSKKLAETSPTELRVSKDFIEMREYLVRRIKESGEY